MKYLIVALVFCISGFLAKAQTNLRTVMADTNGVLQRPTNFTMQQSNVAGLTNALNSKLATNGSAAGLTGFVGTTNAETARGNLGISNTFAGQFHADFYDDFSRYSNGVQFTNGASPLIGSNYVLRWGSGTDPIPAITNGTLTAADTSTWYLSSELERPVYNFGLEWTWETGKNANLSWPVIIIRPDDAWLDKLLHVVVSPLYLNVDVSTNNGAAGFVTIASNSFATTPLRQGERQILSGEIDGNTLRIKLGGKTLEVTDARIGQVNGRYFTYEYFGNYPTTNVAQIYWHRVWANSPNMMEFANQPYSASLFDFANGDARVSRYLTVGTNKSQYNEELATNFPVFIDGGIRSKGRLQGLISGTTYGNAPLVDVRGGTGSNTNTTNRTVLWTKNLAQGTLIEAGTRWEVNAVGSFANNTNEKRVVFEVASNSGLDTGNITDSGEWKINAIIYRTATNFHEAFAIFQSQNTTKTARWTINADATLTVDLEGAATSNNEVILRGVWADWYP